MFLYIYDIINQVKHECTLVYIITNYTMVLVHVPSQIIETMVIDKVVQFLGIV